MGQGSGFGKVIIFGEHFVVHGVPGIVSAIDSTTEAEVIKSEYGIRVRDGRTGSKGYAEEKRLQQVESIERILGAMGYELGSVSLDICLGGTLPGFSGLGASAASSVAIVRAISEELGKDLSDDRVNELAFEAEKAYAGTPSGIDNTAATFGGLLWFKKNMVYGFNDIEKLRIKSPVQIVIGSTGLVANTKAMVEGVAQRKAREPLKYNPIFERAGKLAVEGKKALLDYDLEAVGKLMDENHRLLQEIGVSSRELDYLVDLAKRRGALGAKLTGGGGGGCMVALTPSKKLQSTVAAAIEGVGFQVLRTKIGVAKV